MAFVLTVSAADTVTCNHGAPVTKVPAPKLVVESNPVVTDLGAVSAPPACTMVPTQATPSNVQCTAVSVNVGKATKLTVVGTPVLLGNLAGNAVSPPASPGGALIVVVGPKKLSAI